MYVDYWKSFNSFCYIICNCNNMTRALIRIDKQLASGFWQYLQFVLKKVAY